MSDAVARARELLAKATPGPWEERRHHFMDGEWMESSVVPVEDGDFREGDGDCVRINSCTADAELIAAAPTLLAELADEVERLQAKVAAFADIEEAHNASYRMLRDQSGMTELADAIERHHYDEHRGPLLCCIDPVCDAVTRVGVAT